jgi:hypothetical protein
VAVWVLNENGNPQESELTAYLGCHEESGRGPIWGDVEEEELSRQAAVRILDEVANIRITDGRFVMGDAHQVGARWVRDFAVKIEPSDVGEASVGISGDFEELDFYAVDTTRKKLAEEYDDLTADFLIRFRKALALLTSAPRQPKVRSQGPTLASRSLGSPPTAGWSSSSGTHEGRGERLSSHRRPAQAVLPHAPRSHEDDAGTGWV